MPKLTGEWVAVELAADRGACDTVVPQKLFSGIPTRSSLQSLMEYDVADGHSIPKRHCLVWTEHAIQPRRINMPVADIHKALLSLSRFADMRVESRFGRSMGALIDAETGSLCHSKERATSMC